VPAHICVLVLCAVPGWSAEHCSSPLPGNPSALPLSSSLLFQSHGPLMPTKFCPLYLYLNFVFVSVSVSVQAPHLQYWWGAMEAVTPRWATLAAAGRAAGVEVLWTVIQVGFLPAFVLFMRWHMCV
jgi:hypothetical protein